MNNAMKFNMMVVMTSWAPVRAFNNPASPAQTAPPTIPPRITSGDVDDRRRREREADPERDHAADVHLAVGADVEQPGLEADRDGETGQDQRCRGEERLGDRTTRSERTLEQGAVGIARCRSWSS